MSANSDSADATTLLRDVRERRVGATDELFAVVYAELRRRAARLLRQERRDHSLQITGLVHEAYLRMIQQAEVDWHGKAHFCAVAASAMRRILVDHARRRNRKKRVEGRGRVPLDSALLLKYESAAGVDLERFDELLKRLRQINERAASVVDMRFFGELTSEEIAAVLEVSLSTVEREWRYARAWLVRELGRTPSLPRHPSAD